LKVLTVDPLERLDAAALVNVFLSKLFKFRNGAPDGWKSKRSYGGGGRDRTVDLGVMNPTL
jgi:hypothetical protein